MIGNPKSSGGIASTAKLLEHRPFQELPIGRASGDQGFMMLVEMHQEVVTAPTSQAAKLTCQSQSKFQSWQAVEQVAKSIPE